MYRPKDWETLDIYMALPGLPGPLDLVEAGADAMLKHIIKLVKEKAPSSIIVDILGDEDAKI